MSPSECAECPLSGWRPRPWPPRAPLAGRWTRLDPLAADRHGADLWSALRGEDDVWAHLPYGPFAEEAGFRDWLRGREAVADALTFVILDGAAGPALGLLSLMEIRPQFGVAEIGHVLFAPALQRSRVASEAVRLAAGLVFDELGYRRFEWKCDARNTRSRRAAERFGFRYEGLFRQHMVVKQRNRDTAWFALTDGDWPAARAAFEVWLAPENFDAAGRQIRRLEDIRRQSQAGG